MLPLMQSWSLGGRGLCSALGNIPKFLEHEYCQVSHFMLRYGEELGIGVILSLVFYFIQEWVIVDLFCLGINCRRAGM